MIPFPRLAQYDDEFAARSRPGDWALLKRLRDKPRFLDGAIAYDTLVPPVFANNLALNRLVTQIERMQTIVFTLHLFDSFDPDNPATGLTLSRLRHLCATHGLASKGGVAAFMALMTVTGYLTHQRSELDRRVVHFAPTPKFMALVDKWTEAVLTSVDVIDPGARLVAALKAHPRFGWDMREGGAQRLLGGWKPLGAFPELTHFLAAQSGWMLLCHVTAALLREGMGEKIVPVSVDLFAFGKKFGVSRTHLRRVLEIGHQKGLLDAPPRNGGYVLMSPRLLAACLTAQAGELATYWRSGQEARVRLGLSE